MLHRIIYIPSTFAWKLSPERQKSPQAFHLHLMLTRFFQPVLPAHPQTASFTKIQKPSLCPLNVWALCTQLEVNGWPLIFRASSHPIQPPLPLGTPLCAPLRGTFLWGTLVFIVWPPFHYAWTLKRVWCRRRSAPLPPDPLGPSAPPCLKGGTLQVKTCCTCQNTGPALPDVHESHCSKTSAAALSVQPPAVCWTGTQSTPLSFSRCDGRHHFQFFLQFFFSTSCSPSRAHV